MKRTTKTLTGIAALIGATLVFTTPLPASATSPSRLDVCMAIDDEPLCDVFRSERATTGGRGTDPVVVPVDPTNSGPDLSSGCVRIAHVVACVA